MSTLHTKFKIENKKTGLFFVINDHDTDPNNFLALQVFPSMALDMRTGEIPFNGHHGAYKLPHFYGGRSIILNGLIVGENEESVWEQKRNIDETLELGYGAEYDELVKVTFTNPEGLEITVDATLNASIGYSRSLKEPNILNFQILLKTRTPYLFINDPVFDAIVYTGSLGGLTSTFQIPFQIPFLLQNTSTNILNLTVTNKVKAIITLHGSADVDVVNPSIKNLSTGKSTQFDYTIPKGANNFIRIDALAGTVKDQDGVDLEIFISNGGFIELRNGLNKLSYTSEPDENGVYPEAIFKITGKQFII